MEVCFVRIIFERQCPMVFHLCKRNKQVDAFSRAVNIMVVEDNSLESNLLLAQNRDVKIRELKEKLEKTEDRLYEMRNGLVYRKRANDIFFYVPEAMENHIIRKYHDELGHLGVEKTSDVISKNYWFPSLRSKTKTYVSNCLKCIAFSPSTGRGEGFLNAIPKGEAPFMTYHIDHYGPIDKQRLAKQYILLVVDGFSKFTKLYATKTTETKEVINCLTQHFQNYSRPVNIISDRGTSFTSKEFEDFLNENNIRHIKIATGSPKANGQVERTNRVLGPMLAKVSDNENGKYWYKMLGEVEYALNNTIHKTTAETPSKLLFGVNQRGTIVDAIAEYLERNNITSKNCELEQLRTKAKKNIVKSQERYKAYFDIKRKEPYKYKVGDYVMVRNFESMPGAPKKLIPRFKGPYEIIKELRNCRYVLQDAENFQITQKPYT